MSHRINLKNLFFFLIKKIFFNFIKLIFIYKNLIFFHLDEFINLKTLINILQELKLMLNL